MAEQAIVLEALRRGLIDDDEARRQLSITSTPKKEYGALETVGDVAMSLPTGVADSLTGFAGLSGELQRLIRPNRELAVNFPTRPEIKQAIGEQTGMSLHEPKTTMGRYARSGAEGATSFFNPFNPLGKVAPLFGFGLGIAGQGGEEFLAEQPKLGRFAAEAPVLAGGAAFALKKPQIVKGLGDWMGEYGEERLKRAGATVADTEEALGTKVLLPQAANSAALSDALALAKTVPQGTKLTDITDAQRPAALAKIKALTGAMSERGMNQVDSNAIAKAGGEVVYTAPREARQRATKPLYEASSHDMVPVAGENSLDTIVTSLLSARDAKSLGLTPSGKLIDKTALQIEGQPFPVRVSELDALARTSRDAARAGYQEGADAKLILPREGRASIADAIDAVAKANSPALVGGKMVHQASKEWIEKPLLEGPLGQMFSKEMANKGVATFDDLVTKLDTFSADDIRTIAQGLGKADKEAFPTLVKKSWTDKVEALQKATEGRPSPSVLNDVPMKLRGEVGSQQAAKFDAQIEEIAKLKGLDPAEAKWTANKLMDAFEVVAREQGGGSAGREIVKGSGSGFFVGLLKSAGIMSPLREFGRALERNNYHNVIEMFIDALASPDQLKKLVELSRFSPTAYRAKIVARTAAALSVQEQNR